MKQWCGKERGRRGEVDIEEGAWEDYMEGFFNLPQIVMAELQRQCLISNCKHGWYNGSFETMECFYVRGQTISFKLWLTLIIHIF